MQEGPKERFEKQTFHVGQKVDMMESRTIEFKEFAPSTTGKGWEMLEKYINAFVNTRSGMIVFTPQPGRDQQASS